MTTANGAERLTDTGSHGKVGERSNGSDEERGGVHEAVTVRGALGRNEEEQREARHDEKDDPEVRVAPLG